MNNFAVLKGEFDAFLAAQGGHKFQPVADRATFEQQLAAQPRGLFLMSSWHFKQLAAKAPLDPLFVGHARGKVTQTHRLFSPMLNLADLRGQQVTCAGTLDYTRTLLKEIIPDQADLIASLALLPLPKEIDALTAMEYASSKAAVATESGVEKLGNVSPKLRDRLKAHGAPRESLLPVLAAPRGAGADVLALARALTSPDAAKSFKLLGMDGLRELDAEQRKKLLP